MRQNFTLDRRAFTAVGLSTLLFGCASPATDGRLRVADQLKALQTLFDASGLYGENSAVAWSNFIGGPSIIAAATGNSIDLGWMAETPLVFAQAASSPVKVVAVVRAARDEGVTSGMAIVVRPDSPIRDVADLRGRRIVYAPGTITQYFTLRALEKAGLSLGDVELVTVSPGAAQSLLASGKVDALTTVEPLLSQLLVPGLARVLVPGGAPLSPDLWYLVAPDATLADPRQSALIEAFVVRLGKALAWWRDNPDAATAAAARLYKVSPEIAASIVRRTARRIGPLTPDVIAAQQIEADTFQRIGLIPRRLDVATLYDRRFDAALARIGEPA